MKFHHHFGIFGIFLLLSERFYVVFSDFNFPIARHLSTDNRCLALWRSMAAMQYNGAK